jgi:chemotaxis signal transduction protein
MHTDTFRIGLLVEGVDSVVTPPTDPIDRPAPIDADRLIRGVLEVAGHVVATLDAEAVVGTDVRAYLAASADGLHKLAGERAA